MIHLSSKRIVRFLFCLVIGLAIASFLGQFALVNGSESVWLVNKIDVNSENNLPSWYSSVSLFLCALLLTVISLAKRNEGDRFSRHWTGLAAVFYYLSLDEAASLHEKLNDVVPHFVPDVPILNQAWVWPMAIAVVIFAIIYLPFVRHLPKQSQLLLGLSFALYVGGALGIEVVIEKIGGYFWPLVPEGETLPQAQHLLIVVVVTLEELCEMMGVAVLIYGLLDYVQQSLGNISIGLTPAQGTDTPAIALEEAAIVNPDL